MANCFCLPRAQSPWLLPYIPDDSMANQVVDIMVWHMNSLPSHCGSMLLVLLNKWSTMVRSCLCTS
eukprot:5850737-Amphidinium_carterae.1